MLERALQGLLVYLFGPDVNMANILIEEVPELEEIRDGTFPHIRSPERRSSMDTVARHVHDR